jgi:hypothetical protein
MAKLVSFEAYGKLLRRSSVAKRLDCVRFSGAFAEEKRAKD